MPNKLVEAISSCAKQVYYQVSKHSPAILLAAGLTGLVGSAVWACVVTHKKTTNILAVVDVEKIRLENKESASFVTEQEAKSELNKIYAKATWELTKTYAGPVLLASASIASILASHTVLNNRNVVLASTLSSVTAAFKDYRKSVIEKYGEQEDYNFRHGITTKVEEEPVVDENGEVIDTKVKETKEAAKAKPSDFRFLFSKETSQYWTDDKDANLALISMAQSAMNAKLIRDKQLFLNEVLVELGARKTRMGQSMGWLYRPDDPDYIGDNFVSLGIYTIDPSGNKKFFAEDDQSPDIWIEFNCDGDILHSNAIKEVLD